MLNVGTIRGGTRRHWSPIIGNKLIQKTMTENRFETIKRYIHVNNNDKMLPKNDPNHHRLFKIRPFIKALLDRFKTISLEEVLSIDEQICTLKVYLKNKLHRWGYKVYVCVELMGLRMCSKCIQVKKMMKVSV